MKNNNNWRKFFNRHAPHYMQEPSVQATAAEVDFLIEHLQLTSEQRIRDMGCGTAGNWGIRPVELDEYELMAIVRKPA